MHLRLALTSTACLLLPLALPAQVITPVPGSVPPATPAPLPSLPSATLPAPAPVVPNPPGTYTPLPLNVDPSQLTQPQAAGPAESTSGTVLTLADAEHAALTANPQISAARLLALAADQQTRETRAGLLPTVTGSITAVDTHDNSRITAGALNNPIVYNRAAAGFTGSALLTDFGRTRDLIRAAHLRANAASDDARATAADILLAVDTAYFQALAAQTQVQVAQQNVATSTQSVDQIQALTQAKLRSTLDLSFANVNLSQARLSLLDAENSRAAALNGLNALMGRADAAEYSLVAPDAAPAPPPAAAEPLVQQALTARPDLQSLNTQQAAAQQFSQAEHKLQLPTVTALGATGIAPVRDDHILTSWYGAAGVNLSVPVFNGFLNDARAKEADLRAAAAQARVQTLRDSISRDVRQAVLQARNAWERINVSQQLLTDAQSSYSLASTRYQLGLSSVVELSQAQLAQTQAQIGLVNAKYTYQLASIQLRYQAGQ